MQAKKKKVRRRREAIARKLTDIEGQTVDEQGVATALSTFGPVWDELFQAEKERIVRLVVERVDCGGAVEALALTPKDSGIRALAWEMASSDTR